MNDACDDAGYGPRCLNFHVDYTTKKKGPDKECFVDDVEPRIGKRVTTITRVRLTVSCGESEDDTSQKNPDTTKREGRSDESRNDKQDGRPDESRNDKQDGRTDESRNDG